MLMSRRAAAVPLEEYPESTCIHDLFVAQAARTPEHVALADGRETWTYAQLDGLTNQLARRLKAGGIGPEVTVGCYLANPTLVVVHLLAVLKAGGRYLLLDPRLPPARVRYMVTDAAPRLIVHDTVLPRMVSQATRASVSTDELARAAAGVSDAPVTADVTPANAAYLAYTSGSTGRPKGVVITHGSTVAHARAFTGLFRLTPHDRVPLMAPSAVDVATEEIVPALLSGCRLIASTSTHDDMAEFTREVVARRYSVLNVPASLWHRWTEHLHDTGQAVPPDLRLVIAGSEQISTRTLREWLALPGAAAVQWVAAYGVTECTVTSSFYLSAATDDLSGEQLVPIGKPVPGTWFYIVDPDDGRIVRDGAVGELLIGGLGLARGYIRLPEETHRRFVTGPLPARAASRVYRTGDLVRRRPDGNLVWVGRLDGQIKLHGLRIEPGEIEAVLTDHPDISAALVALRPGAGLQDGEQLVAYVVARAGRAVNVAQVIEHVRQRVHPLMVPTRVQVLARLPRTVGGKLDRTGLREPRRTAARHQNRP